MSATSPHLSGLVAGEQATVMQSGVPMTGLLQIISGLVGDTLRTASFGLVAGLAAAFALMRALSSAAEGFPVFGPGPYLIATAIILVAAAAATLLPSLRTARIDPSRALRVD